MPKKCASSLSTTVPPNATAACCDLISMLEHQLRTARSLHGELSERSVPEAQSTILVVDYCAELRAEAVEVVQATAMLQEEVCSPADAMRKTNAHEEVNTVLERITGYWAELPGVRPDSKRHKTLLEKIHVASAAYLKIADAARGVDRKADARAGMPVG